MSNVFRILITAFFMMGIYQSDDVVRGGLHPGLVVSQSQDICRQMTIHSDIDTYGQFRVLHIFAAL